MQPSKQLRPRRRQSLWCVTKKIGYKGALASFHLKDYRDINGIPNDMYRIITKNMASFPTELLYTPRRALHNTVLGDSAAYQTQDADGRPCGRGEAEGRSGKSAFSSGKGERG